MVTEQSAVKREIQDDVWVLRINHPPVNGISQGIRAALLERLDEARKAGAEAIVLMGEGRMFSAGADLAEFDSGLAVSPPDPNDVHRTIEQMPVPVVAAIHGSAFGGAMELALACDARIAAGDARMGLPEVTLGVIPGAGGTQRLPRLIGAEAAGRLISTGKAVDARTAAELGLVDRIAGSDLTASAIELAKELSETSDGRPPLSELPAPNLDPEILAGLKDGIGRRSPHREASEKALNLIAESAGLPFQEGASRERELFLDLLHSTTSKALRHLFFAERAAAKVGSEKPTTTRKVESVGVIGAGTMGSGIAIAFAKAGFPVVLVDKDEKSLRGGLDRIGGIFKRARARGGQNAESVDAQEDRISGETDSNALRACDLIIEAVFEDMEVKQQVFSELDQTAKPGAVLATNTSALDVNAIAKATQRPQDVLGTHFFSPAHVMRLLEVVEGDKTDPSVLSTVVKLARKIGKTPVVVGICDGFCANRLLYPYLRQVDLMMEEGALPDQVDRALTEFGFAMGPCSMLDMAGQDVAWAVRQRQLKSWPEGKKYSRLADLLVERKRYGVKSGAGWYRYSDDGRSKETDPEVEEMIRAESERHGITRREISDEEIVKRSLLALVNEGANVVAEGIVRQPSDIDLCYVHGMGFPASRGGPMFWADQVGLDQVYNDIRRLRDRHDDLNWEPASLLQRLVESSESFSNLNQRPE